MKSTNDINSQCCTYSNLANKKENERGITLIALVITIIVLIILALVGIAMLTGENGILLKAEKAKKETEISSIEEEIQIKVLEIQTQEDYEKNFYDKLQKKLQETDKNAEINDYLDEKIKIITYKNHQFTIENYKVKHYSKCTYCENGQEEKDYVENDLFARYDGIENTRSGHSDSTTTWEDISGHNRDLKMYNTTATSKTLFWENNGLVQTAPSNVGLVTDQIEELKDLKQYTLELVLYVAQDNDVNETKDIFNVVNNKSSPWIGTQVALQKNNKLSATVVNNNDSLVIREYDFERCKPIYVAISVDKNVAKTYINGELYATDDKTDGEFIIREEIESVICMFNFYWYSNTDNSFIGKIYSARLYSKTLDENEISKNYLLDKERFNLEEKTNNNFGYIQQNLFAHYNGKNNTRCGHRSTKYWEDISGNNRDLKMTCNLNEHIYWEEDGLVQNTESSMVLKTEIIPEIQNLKENTVEIILRPDKDGTTISRDIFSIIQSSSVPYAGLGFDLVTNKGLYAGVNESNDNTEGLKQYQCDLNTPICLTLVSEDYNNGAGKIKLYVNGNKYAERQRKKEGFYIKDNASSYMAMFGFYPYCSNYENSFVGKIYSTRIYSKALTDEEISANFEIDKSLYNLNL